MNRSHAFASAALATLFVANSYAIQGHVFYSIGEPGEMAGTYKRNLETGTTTKLADWGGYAEITVSPDGRQVAACGLWQADGGILVVNTDGTHDSTLLHGSDYNGSSVNKYPINSHDQSTYNYGLGRICSFGPKGVYFVRCVGQWPDQSSKVLCYADRATGMVHEVIDFSAVDDGHQALFVTADGRKALSWSHSYTVAMDINATHDGGSYHLITGIWGHGPITPNDGSVVIINNIRGSCDMLSPETEYDHRTWVVYDWVNGACGNYLHRYASPSASPTGTGTQAMVKGSTATGQNGEDYIAFGTDNGNAYLLHWSTGTAEQIARFGDVYLGTLPTGDQPALSVTPASVSFTASGSQNVTVSNIGAGTLSKVSASVSYAGGSGWLTATVQGNGGNTQTIANTVDASSLSPGSYSATVTVSGGGATNTAVYTVSVNLNVPGDVATSVSGVRYRHVTVTWTDNSTGETGFSIERSLDGGAYSVVGTAAANVTSFVDSNVTCGTGTYSYRLRAAFTGGSYSGYSAASDIVVSCADWVDVTAPTAGTVYGYGDTVWIRWDVSNVAQVYIDGSLDNEETWVQISVDGGVSPSMAGWGNYPWVPTLPPGMDSSTVVVVRVAKYTQRALINDVSETFTVRGPQSVRGAAAPRSALVSGLGRSGLISLAANTPIVYTLRPGEQGIIRVFLPNGALVRSVACTEPGTHAVAAGVAIGRGLYLVDMVVQ